jgi:uncharacterized protein YcbX
MLGEELNASVITETGVLGDRALALLDNETGHVVSAKNPKKWPDIFAYRAAYTAPPALGALPAAWISLPDGRVVRSDDENVNEVLSAALARPVTLKNNAPAQSSLEQFWPEFEGEANDVSQEAVAGDAPSGTFFDYAMLHILTTSSLAKLVELYPEGRYEMRRFRPNIVVDTAGQHGFVENEWVGKTIRIGDSVRLLITDPCPRCVMPTLAQGDLPKDPAIFKKGIAQNNVFVPFAGKPLPSIGVYARVIATGTVKRGDAIVFED